MATLQDILANAQHGDAMTLLARAYGLTPEQTQSAVDALLPAISMGLKRSTSTPEGLGELFDVAGRQPELFAMYEDPDAALSPEGVAAGNAALANMFGSPEASRAIAAQAQQLSGVGGAILKKILPVLVGMLLSGLMRGGSGQAAPAPQQPMPRQQMPEQGGGGLFDIFREIFQQGAGGSAGPSSYPQGQGPVPPLGDILDTIGGGQRTSAGQEQPKFPIPDASPDLPGGTPQSQPLPYPPASGGEPTLPGGQGMPDGDIFGQILKELGKAIQEGRVKPVIIGPGGIPFPGQQPSGDGQTQPQGGGAGGNIFGEILKEVLGGALGQGQAGRQAFMGSAGAGSAVFGDALETGKKVAQHHAESLQEIFDRFGSVPPQAD